MNPWLVAATILLVALAAPGLVCLRARPLDGLVALELASAVVALVLLLVAEGFHRGAFVDLAIVAAVASFIGSLAFVRLLEREP
jgi:multisubunit Na+/H+ antiporter MnhF subunit